MSEGVSRCPRLLSSLLIVSAIGLLLQITFVIGSVAGELPKRTPVSRKGRIWVVSANVREQRPFDSKRHRRHAPICQKIDSPDSREFSRRRSSPASE